MNERVIQDSKGRFWLVETRDGNERRYYWGRNRTEPEMEDLRRWCRQSGISLLLTEEAKRKARLADEEKRDRKVRLLAVRRLGFEDQRSRTVGRTEVSYNVAKPGEKTG